MTKKLSIIGGGQLARMIGQENLEKNYGYEITVLDPSMPECPAKKYVNHQIVGKLNDEAKILELGKNNPDSITIEVEHTNVDGMEKLEDLGFKIYPSSKTIKKIQDKFLQYKFFVHNDIPVPESFEIKSVEDLENLKSQNKNFMLKQCIGSYDGKGNLKFSPKDDVQKSFDYFSGNDFFAQSFVNFDKEISVIIGRDIFGNMEVYDVVENIHTSESILDFSIVPARIEKSLREEAKSLAMKIAESFEDVGILAIEMFYEASTNKIWINEIAPRVHNSGHWTMDGTAKTSQFEQHLRAVTGQKLGSVKRENPVVMINILGPENNSDFNGKVLEVSIDKKYLEKNIKIFSHMYGKTSKPSRKIGHINVVGNENMSSDELFEIAKKLKEKIIFKIISGNTN